MPDAAGLVVTDLTVDVPGLNVDIVSDVSFAVPAGSALGIVGESGCGKTTVAMALLGFARPGTRIAAGCVDVNGIDVLTLNDQELRAIRGRVVSFVPQNPSRSLSPGMLVGEQIREMLAGDRLSRDEEESRVRAAWTAAQLPDARDIMGRYPHQLSGGQQQRVTIAMALIHEPAVVVMDEPTTGLDVLTQARLLEVIRELRSQREACIVYVSHDLSVVRSLVDRIAVMYGGRIVEEAAVDDLFRWPRHPYTRRLLEAIPRVRASTRRLRGIPGHAVEPWNRPAGCPFEPRCDYRVEKCLELPPHFPVNGGSHTSRCWRWSELQQSPEGLDDRGSSRARPDSSRGAASPSASADSFLVVRDLVAAYGPRRSRFSRRDRSTVALRGASMAMRRGSCLALVGETGSGKTTLGRCLAGLHAPVSGEILFEGQVLRGLAKQREASTRRRIQIVFQDPDSSLNPSMTIESILRRPLRQFFNLGRKEERARVGELLESVHLAPAIASRVPIDLSGGEKQRVAIARALAAEPELLICDEITSALDVAVQASILELLDELRSERSLSMLFISHDLAVVKAVSDAVIVLSDGEVRESASRDELFERPKDPYTQSLLNAVPDLREHDYPGSWGASPLVPSMEGA